MLLISRSGLIEMEDQKAKSAIHTNTECAILQRLIHGVELNRIAITLIGLAIKRVVREE